MKNILPNEDSKEIQNGKRDGLWLVSVALWVTFVAIFSLSLIAILLLGGTELFGYLFVTVVQAFGLGLAATASFFFFLRLVWRMRSVPMTISMVLFVLGVGLFMSVSVGRLYALQYPMYVNSFGPGHGPGLPLSNVITFFKSIDSFPRIVDIARDPNDVPPPITVSTVNDSTKTALDILDTESLEGMTEVLEPISEPPATTERPMQKLYLETTEVLSEIAPGITYNYWTFNNAVPGPLFRVQEGDYIEVTIKNLETNLHKHNVDFHAATGPGGGGTVSVVAPGETKVFYFKALNPGLFVYHCAVPNVAVHMAHGMYGMILVEPKEGLPEVDKEFYVMQGELYTAGALGRKGLQIFDAGKMLKGIPDYITFNGRPGSLAEKMQAEVGDRVRLYVGNGGVSYNSNFHVIGEIFDTVYPEASMNSSQLKNIQTTNIPAGGATIVEFTVDYPGNYILVDHALSRIDKGAWGILHVTGAADPTIFKGDASNPGESGH